METMTETATRYRYLGVTDERVECDACGRTELRSTVVLAPLDADGNDDGVVYFGSSCAARALGRPTRDGAKVLDLARNAHERLRGQMRDALEFLAYIGVDVQGRPMFTRNGERKWGPAARRYAIANPVRGGQDDMVGRVQSAVARRVAVLADARALGLLG